MLDHEKYSVAFVATVLRVKQSVSAFNKIRQFGMTCWEDKEKKGLKKLDKERPLPAFAYNEPILAKERH